jgi:hypothetical protein
MAASLRGSTASSLLWLFDDITELHGTDAEYSAGKKSADNFVGEKRPFIGGALMFREA